jgi:hypothetical protein
MLYHSYLTIVKLSRRTRLLIKISLGVIGTLSNFAIFATILYEAHAFATGNLSTQKFYRLQLVKSVYIGVLTFIILRIIGWVPFGWAFWALLFM